MADKLKSVLEDEAIKRIQNGIDDKNNLALTVCMIKSAAEMEKSKSDRILRAIEIGVGIIGNIIVPALGFVVITHAEFNEDSWVTSKVGKTITDTITRSLGYKYNK